MHLHVVVSRDGLINDTALVVDRGVRLYASPRARRKIMDQMRQLGNMCQRCSLICRTDELVDGVCAEGVGCAADVDADMIYPPPELAGMVFPVSDLPHRIWGSCVDTIVRLAEQGQKQAPPQAEEDGQVPW